MHADAGGSSRSRGARSQRNGKIDDIGELFRDATNAPQPSEMAFSVA
jgi:hypothetical protein